jgi:hypothetical protein
MNSNTNGTLTIKMGKICFGCNNRENITTAFVIGGVKSVVSNCFEFLIPIFRPLNIQFYFLPSLSYIPWPAVRRECVSWMVRYLIYSLLY